MGNHLRAVLDEDSVLITDNIRQHLSQHQHKEILRQLQESASRAMCFDLGEADDLSRLWSPAIPNMHIRLPYECVWFEYTATSSDSESVLFGIMADELVNGEAHLTVFGRVRRTWFYVYSGITEMGMKAIRPNHVAEHSSLYETPLATIRTAICAMQCVNIQRTEHRPNQKLNKAREKRGKKPLFSYWTLNINVPTVKNSMKETRGTHVSPRLHLRRGHIREYAPGKLCWVRQCAVGHKELGIVHKDYSVHPGIS